MERRAGDHQDDDGGAERRCGGIAMDVEPRTRAARPLVLGGLPHMRRDGHRAVLQRGRPSRARPLRGAAAARPIVEPAVRRRRFERRHRGAHRHLGGRTPAVELLRLPHNVGKGEAIRAGMLHRIGCAGVLAYLDADLASPPSELLRVLDVVVRDDSVDFAMGSRVALLGHQHRAQPTPPLSGPGLRHAGLDRTRARRSTTPSAG